MTALVETVSAAFIVIGGAFLFVGSLGLAKLPDTMRRLHGPTKATTLGVGSLLIASMLYFAIVHQALGFHELLITLFLFLTAPVSANMVAKAHIFRSPGVQQTLSPDTGGSGWGTLAPPPARIRPTHPAIMQMVPATRTNEGLAPSLHRGGRNAHAQTRILVLSGETPSSGCARDYAFYLAPDWSGARRRFVRASLAAFIDATGVERITFWNSRYNAVAEISLRRQLRTPSGLPDLCQKIPSSMFGSS